MPPFSLKIAFVESQHTATSHPKLLKQLIQHYQKSDFEQFVEQFTTLLRVPLTHGDKQPGVERTLNFVAKFATAPKTDKFENNEEEEEENEDDMEGEIDPFLVRLVRFLLDNHEASSKAVRLRVCQLINRVLNNMGEHASIDDELYSIIYDTMLQRLLDKVPSVRLQAILALARLQDPTNKQCPVIKAYRFHLSMDPNPDVRRAVLNNIAITFQTLPDIIERIRDVRDVVRRQVYLVLSQKVHIRSLTIGQRVRLISEGLNDRSEAVKAAVEKMLIPAWLRLVDGNVLDLLTCLDVEASTKDAELALGSLFSDVPYCDIIKKFNLLNTQKVIEPTELRPESALYWRVLVQYLRSENAEDAIDSVVPDLSYYCLYVKEFVLSPVPENDDPQELAVRLMEKEFVIQQLVAMTKFFDLSDEVGRKSLDHLVRTLLVCESVGEASIKSLVEVFSKLHSPTSMINQLAEIISDVREPEPATAVTITHSPNITDDNSEELRKHKLKVAKVKFELNELKEQLEECVRSLDLEKAQTLKEKLKEAEEEEERLSKLMPTKSANEASAATEAPNENIEEKSDPETLTRCLTIVCQMLRDIELDTITPTLHSLHDNLLLPCLKSQDPTVRNHTIQALGLICLMSKDYAKRHLLLFVQISQIDIEEIQLTALQCIFDFLLLYGLNEFSGSSEDMANLPGMDITVPQKEEEDDETQDGSIVVTILSKMLDNENVEIRTLVAEGLCKLLLACYITSSKLLTHLILKWYNPTSEDDHMLRHMLGVFFPLYASHGGANQESLANAILPTLHTLFNAPSKSPLAEIDVDDVASFLVSITSLGIVSNKSKEVVNIHDTLVFKLCAEILGHDGSFTRTLVKCLNHLSLTPTNFSTLRQVEVLADKLSKKVTDRTSRNGIDKFQTNVRNYLKMAPDPASTQGTSEGQGGSDETLAVDTTATSDLTISDKTIDSTAIRRKRLLYNTINTDMEIFSSDVDSEIDTPKKAKCNNKIPQIAKTTSLASEAILQKLEETCEGENGGEIEINVSESTITNSTIVSPNSSEVTFKTAECCDTEQDALTSPQSKVETSEDEGTSPENNKTPSSKRPASRRQTKNKLTPTKQTVIETSDEELFSPPKSRKTRSSINTPDPAPQTRRNVRVTPAMQLKVASSDKRSSTRSSSQSSQGSPAQPSPKKLKNLDRTSTGRSTRSRRSNQGNSSAEETSPSVSKSSQELPVPRTRRSKGNISSDSQSLSQESEPRRSSRRNVPSSQESTTSTQSFTRTRRSRK